MALTVIITSADGQQYRVGADEPDAAWVPQGITWESTVPGGWKEASFSLRRRIDEDVPLRLFDEVEILDEHGQTLYEGRIAQLPRQHGDDFLFNVRCLGWASHLLDDPSVPYFYVSRDLSGWHGPSRTRQAALLTTDFPPGDDPTVGVDATTGIPALVLSFTGAWVAPKIPAVDAWFDAGAGSQIASMYYDFAGQKDTTASFILVANSADGDDAADETSADLFTATTGSGTYTPATARRYVSWTWRFSATSSGFDGYVWACHLRYLALFGNHGLTKRGAAPDEGYYIDDMLAHALALGAPKLNFTTGDGGSIERPPLVIQQAADLTRGTVDRILLDLNKYVIWDWLVYENKTFFYRPTDPDRLTWEARLDQGVHLNLEGDDAEHAYNGAMVRYTEPGGTQKVAGPTGSGLDVESDLLLDDDPDNTVSAHGYPRRWIELDISFPTLGDYAVAIGAAYLAQAALPSRSGDITLPAMVEHPTKGMRPSREVRAGDWIKVTDSGTPDIARRCLSVNHQDDSGVTTVSVGNDLNKVDALLEQVQIKTSVRLGA